MSERILLSPKRIRIYSRKKTADCTWYGTNGPTVRSAIVWVGSALSSASRWHVCSVRVESDFSIDTKRQV